MASPIELDLGVAGAGRAVCRVAGGNRRDEDRTRRSAGGALGSRIRWRVRLRRTSEGRLRLG